MPEDPEGPAAGASVDSELFGGFGVVLLPPGGGTATSTDSLPLPFFGGARADGCVGVGCQVGILDRVFGLLASFFKLAISSKPTCSSPHFPSCLLMPYHMLLSFFPNLPPPLPMRPSDLRRPPLPSCRPRFHPCFRFYLNLTHPEQLLLWLWCCLVVWIARVVLKVWSCSFRCNLEGCC
ncbi:hypothetical protein BGX38DRAFT_608813 [Terfezia claveryi]|nr:hypothetical protein BGX38DRAFT_608813 [Terfezia claveryi]